MFLASWSGSPLTPREERELTRRIAAAVGELEGCLGGLPSAERRLLAARGGVSGRPRSRQFVARRLRLTQQGARAVERNALRDLLSMAASGACAGAGAPRSPLAGAAVSPPPVGYAPSRVLGAGGAAVAGAPPPAFPALLDASPFSRVSIAAPASAAIADDGGMLSLDSWQDLLLVVTLLALLAILLLALKRSRGELRDWRPRMPSRGA